MSRLIATIVIAGSVDEVQQFMLVSLVIGSRAPDMDGHSLFNMESLRMIHADPSAKGQYTHCLRGPDDNYEAGNAVAVTGIRQMIFELLDEAEELLSLPSEDQL